MTDKPKPESTDREAKLAAALRANLRRRKATGPAPRPQKAPPEAD